MVYGSILHAWRPFSLAPAAKWLSLVGWRCQIAFVALDWLDFLIYRGKSITLPLSHYANLASRAHLWRQWVSSSKWILLSWPKKNKYLKLKILSAYSTDTFRFVWYASAKSFDRRHLPRVPFNYWDIHFAKRIRFEFCITWGRTDLAQFHKIRPRNLHANWRHPWTPRPREATAEYAFNLGGLRVFHNSQSSSSSLTE